MIESLLKSGRWYELEDQLCYITQEQSTTVSSEEEPEEKEDESYEMLNSDFDAQVKRIEKRSKIYVKRPPIPFRIGGSIMPSGKKRIHYRRWH